MHGAPESARAKQLLRTGGAGPGGIYAGGSTVVAGGRTQSWRDFSTSVALSSVRAANHGSQSFSRASVGRPGAPAAAGGSGSASGWAAVLQVRAPPRPGAPMHLFRAQDAAASLCL